MLNKVLQTIITGSIEKAAAGKSKACLTLAIVFSLSAPLHAFNLDEAVTIMQGAEQSESFERLAVPEKTPRMIKKERRKKLRSDRSGSSENDLVQAARLLTTRNAIQRKIVVQRARSPLKQRRVVSSYQPDQFRNADDLFSAATAGDLTQLSQLIRQGIDINAGNRERETALHMASARGHYRAVIYLVNHGADINARTVKNWIPLHHAVRFRHPNIVNYLVKKGAAPYARTSDGLSAIDMAKTFRDQRLLSLLGAR